MDLRTAEQDKPWKEALRAFLNAPTAILAVMFAVTYGIARITCDGYYSNFGITPEDVGLTQLVMVAKAGYLFAIVIALFGSAIAAVVLGVTVVRIPAQRFHHAAQDAPVRQQLWNGLLTAVFPSLLILGMLGIFAQLLLLKRVTTVGGSTMQQLGLIDGLSFFVAAAFGWNASLSKAPGGAPSTGWWQEIWTSFKSARVRRMLAGSSGAIVLGVAIVALTNGLNSSANSDAYTLLRQGKSPNSLASFIYAPSFPAQVIPLGNDPAHLCSRNGTLILLGSNGQTVYVLLRPKDTSKVTVTVLSLRNDQYAVALGSRGNQPCSTTTSIEKPSASPLFRVPAFFMTETDSVGKWLLTPIESFSGLRRNFAGISNRARSGASLEAQRVRRQPALPGKPLAVIWPSMAVKR